MKTFITSLFYILNGILLVGLVIRIEHWIIGCILFMFGLLGLMIFFIAKTIKDFIKKRKDTYIILLQIIIVLMSVILFCKYLFQPFCDYLGLLTIPLFILMSAFYLTKWETRYIELTTTVVTYLLLTIPLFGLDFHQAPRQYIPKDWYNRYDVGAGVPVDLPYGFSFKETEELSIKAFDLRKSEDYYSAIIIYRKALTLEPQNPRLLFDMSDCYARINDLETAIYILDSAIMIDSAYAGFYNNRGLLYYKLKENDKAILDFTKAIQIDSTQPLFYENIALAYYYNNLYYESCEAIKQVEKFGIKIEEVEGLKKIKEKICK